MRLRRDEYLFCYLWNTRSSYTTLVKFMFSSLYVRVSFVLVSIFCFLILPCLKG